MAPGDRTQNLTLKAQTEGFDDAERKVRALGESTKGIAQDAGQKTDARELSESLEAGKTKLQRLEEISKGVVLRTFQVVTAIRLVGTALAALPSTISIVRSGLAIIAVLRDEVAERLRLVEVMGRQGRAQETLNQKRQRYKDTLERVAGRRRVGGFDSPDAARSAAQQAARAQEQFGALKEEDVNQAVGKFGDVGLDQQDITDLAIIASFGESFASVDQFGSKENIRRAARRKIARFRPRIDKFRNTETLQGDGQGDKAFRAEGQPTEREQRILDQAQSPGGPDDELRAALERKFGADGSFDIDRAVRLIKRFGSAKALGEAETGYLSHPISTLTNKSRLVPQSSIELQGEPGMFNQALDAIGATVQFENLPEAELEQIKSFMRETQRRGTGQTPVNITINNNQHSKNFARQIADIGLINGQNRLNAGRGP